MDYTTALGYCSNPKLKCKVETVTCYKYVICDVDNDGSGNNPPPPAPRLVFRNLNGDLCWKHHIYSNIICCEYVCNSG